MVLRLRAPRIASAGAGADSDIAGGFAAPAPALAAVLAAEWPAHSLAGGFAASAPGVAAALAGDAPSHAIAGGFAAPAPSVAAALPADAPGFAIAAAFTAPSPSFAATLTATLDGASIAGGFTAPSPGFAAALTADAPGFAVAAAFTAAAPSAAAALAAAAASHAIAGGFTAPAPGLAAALAASLAGASIAGGVTVPAPGFAAALAAAPPGSAFVVLLLSDEEGSGLATAAGELLLWDGRTPIVALLRLSRLIVPGLALDRPARAELRLRRPVLIRITLDRRPAMARMQVTQGEALEVKLRLETPAGLPVTNATGVGMKAKPPAGTVRTYAAVAGSVPGEWLASVLFDVPGRWWVAAECTGPTASVAETTVDVLPRQVA